MSTSKATRRKKQPYVPASIQDDLTANDHTVVETDKIFACDDEIPQPLQDPNYIPASVIDENGDRT